MPGASLAFFSASAISISSSLRQRIDKGAPWTIVPRDSVVHRHLCHEGGARVAQVAREPVGRTEFVILETRPQGVFLEYLCHDRREW